MNRKLTILKIFFDFPHIPAMPTDYFYFNQKKNVSDTKIKGECSQFKIQEAITRVYTKSAINELTIALGFAPCMVQPSSHLCPRLAASTARHWAARHGAGLHR